jgi:hypothetical protein
MDAMNFDSSSTDKSTGRADHSPLPWFSCPIDDLITIQCGPHWIAELRCYKDGPVTSGDLKRQKADADFIVEACNNYKPLPPASETATPKECPECTRLTTAYDRLEKQMAAQGNFGIVPLPTRCSLHNNGSDILGHETDKQIFYRDSQPVVDADFARSLERRLAAATRELEILKWRVGDRMHPPGHLIEQAEAWRAVVAALMRTPSYHESEINKADTGLAHAVRTVEHLAAARRQGEEMRKALLSASTAQSNCIAAKRLLEPIYGATNYAPIGGPIAKAMDHIDAALEAASFMVDFEGRLSLATLSPQGNNQGAQTGNGEATCQS